MWIYNKSIIWIPTKNWWLSGYNMYISIYKTLKSNGYKCYFLQPTFFVKKYLLLAWVDEKDILETNELKWELKYSWNHTKEYKQLITFIKTFFWKKSFNSILKESLIEYYQYDYLIKKYNINTILIYNGIFRVWRLAWLDNNCRVIYFENWYFPHTIQIDDKWVNADASIADMSYEEILSYKKPSWKIQDTYIFRSNPIGLLKKILYYFKSYNLNIFFHYLVAYTKKYYEIYKRKVILFFEKEVTLARDKYVFLALQVHDDTQLIFNSPFVKKPEEIITLSYDILKEEFKDYKIVVKEHPMDIWRISYDKIREKYKDIIWIRKWNIDDVIEKSEYVVCINSSVWLQALSKYKKVFTFWKNFYSNNPWVENLKSLDTVREQFLELKNKKLNTEEIDKYIGVFKNEIFIEWEKTWWAWESFNKKTVKDICEYIVKD